MILYEDKIIIKNLSKDANYIIIFSFDLAMRLLKNININKYIIKLKKQKVI